MLGSSGVYLSLDEDWLFRSELGRGVRTYSRALCPDGPSLRCASTQRLYIVRTIFCEARSRLDHGKQMSG